MLHAGRIVLLLPAYSFLPHMDLLVIGLLCALLGAYAAYVVSISQRSVCGGGVVGCACGALQAP